jgi:hypothetical protein
MHWLDAGGGVTFRGTNFLPAEGITPQVALLLLLFVVAVGAVVGAVHRLMLIGSCTCDL